MGGFIIGGFIVIVASYGFAAGGLIGTFFVVGTFLIAVRFGVSRIGEFDGIDSFAGLFVVASLGGVIVRGFIAVVMP